MFKCRVCGNYYEFDEMAWEFEMQDGNPTICQNCADDMRKDNG